MMKFMIYEEIAQNASLIEEFAAAYEEGEHPLEKLFELDVRRTLKLLRAIKDRPMSETQIMKETGLIKRQLRNILLSLKEGGGGFRDLNWYAVRDPEYNLRLRFNPPKHNRFLQSNSTAPRRESSLTST